MVLFLFRLYEDIYFVLTFYLLFIIYFLFIRNIDININTVPDRLL